MGKLIIVSNRLPVSVAKRKKGVAFIPSVGGLATGLSGVFNPSQSVWIGWPGQPTEKIKDDTAAIARELGAKYGCSPVFLAGAEVESYYAGFSNRTIWPLFHYFPKYTEYNQGHWEAYQRVNQRFADAALAAAAPGDTIWVHDYQLMLVPEMIRRKAPEAAIGFFLHIPFPTFEVFRLLPWRNEILKGLLGADLAGFHTYDYAQYFMRATQRLLGYESHLGLINDGQRVVRSDAFPISIDFARYSGSGLDAEVMTEMAVYRERLAGRKVILSIDRMDYTKGIRQRLEALDVFFTRNPQWKEKAVFILVAVPSRAEVDRYQSLKRNVDETISRINGTHGSIGWTPVEYLYRSLPFKALAALYNLADAALITPVRDGMNLVAKEYLAARRDEKGVLILSEMAGAAAELGEALIVNPNDIVGMAAAIKEALEMPEGEQVRRNAVMRRRIARYDVSRWSADFLARLEEIKKTQTRLGERLLTAGAESRMAAACRAASQRLFLLDYDGTLASYRDEPAAATPSPRTLDLLAKLAANPSNHLVLLSGRDKDTLAGWFGGLGISLVAEHGAAFREAGTAQWEFAGAVPTQWKDEIRAILDLYADRTPGAFVEEKELSLVWHYRKANAELAMARVNELKDNLVALTANLGLHVQAGHKNIEVKVHGVTKGQATMRWLGRGGWDFIFAAGDDTTDEDIFAVLPAEAWSIRVGLVPSAANYNLPTHRETLAALERLADC